jgi:hypothetical protein
MATTKNNVVTATLSVNFSKNETSGNKFLSWQVDDRSEEDGGLNLGDTSFSPGDTAFLLLFRESSVRLDETFTSAGTLTKAASGQIYVFSDEKDTTEYITVSNSNTANLSKPCNVGTPSLSWLGKNLKVGKGTPKLEMDKNSDGTTSEVVINLGTEMVGVIKAEYSSSAQAYKLSGVPTDYPSAIVFATGTIE